MSGGKFNGKKKSKEKFVLSSTDTDYPWDSLITKQIVMCELNQILDDRLQEIFFVDFKMTLTQKYGLGGKYRIF